MYCTCMQGKCTFSTKHIKQIAVPPSPATPPLGHPAPAFLYTWASLLSTTVCARALSHVIQDLPDFTDTQKLAQNHRTMPLLLKLSLRQLLLVATAVAFTPGQIGHRQHGLMPIMPLVSFDCISSLVLLWEVQVKYCSPEVRFTLILIVFSVLSIVRDNCRRSSSLGTPLYAWPRSPNSNPINTDFFVLIKSFLLYVLNRMQMLVSSRL